MSNKLNIFLFRNDLRLADNLAFYESCKSNNVLLVYVLENEEILGEASKCWLYHSLISLNRSLDNKLNFYSGNSKDILSKLIKKFDVECVYWNERYEPTSIKIDSEIKSVLELNQIKHKTFNSYLLRNPWEVLKDDNSVYKVFTPFMRKGYLNHQLIREPISAPEKISAIKDENSLSVSDFNLLPQKEWHIKMLSHWKIGEVSAQAQLYNFIDKGLKDYKTNRNYMSYKNISKLSPYLHFGEISPNQVFYAAKMKSEIESGLKEDFQSFLNELVWRDFSYYILYYFPGTTEQNYQTEFNKFPWQANANLIKAWQKAETGYPIIDAAMRELWQTGFMHNRSRMIVASFLTKNLLIHWHWGRDWFWNCLVDADLANNSMNWQWVAGCGTDAAPYYRIFNPVIQGEKFDPNGEYILKYLPELKRLPKKYLFKPWEAPASVLKESGIKLGENYPNPIVNLEESRRTALAAYKAIKTN